eukprot:CAMPEP_0176315914 /NCGR_PEP_ID=MMETSP0121_2-20121125/68456_1 /TAXON_ID=160619 /ORGANISM="Kryptoperidinium foliaceum, Strain CCMP 1326" /LENGTH=40 /DNA_ID= /DNA_START= /DNA_END= /DNA_ORIENTATION=
MRSAAQTSASPSKSPSVQSSLSHTSADAPPPPNGADNPLP